MAGKRNKKDKEVQKADIKGTTTPLATPSEGKGSMTPRWKVISRIVIAVLLPALFFGFVFSICMNLSLNDPDLWWHLKTGEYIVKYWEVPQEDPFAYTTPRPLDEDKKTGLRAQWLGQVVFYAAYSMGGLAGIGVLRNILIVLPMLILYIWLIRNGLPFWAAFIFAALPTMFLAFQLFYSFERPQGISFLLVMVAAMLIERVRARSREGGRFDFSYWFLPLVMALWSNLHAGFIIGGVIIMAYMGSEIVRAAYNRAFKGSWDLKPAFFIVCAVALSATVLNPNGGKLFYPYVKGLTGMFFQTVSQITSPQRQGWVESVVLEYKPLYYFYQDLGYRWIMFYWVFTGLLWASMLIKYWLRRSIDLGELITVGIMTFFANYYARGLMFSLTILPFYMGKTIAETRFKELKFRLFNLTAIVLFAVLTFSFTSYTYKDSPYLFRPGITKQWVTPWYPTRLVEFVKMVKPPPPMYNFYTWGGFLIWSLYPEYRVFIDGRALDDLINRTADSMLKSYPGWEDQLAAYGINFMIIPVVFRESGHVIPLATALVGDDRWKLIFIRNNSLIYIRDIPQNRDLIQRFNIDKKAVWRELIDVENIFLSGDPNNPVFNVAKAEALIGLEFYDEARGICSRFPMAGAHCLQKLTALGH